MKKPSGKKKKQLYDKETARQRILALFFYDPYQEFALSEIAEQGKVSKSTASRIILELEEQGLITLIKHRLVWRIQANHGNSIFKQEKILFNLSILYRSNLIQYLEEIFKHPKSVILFGSFSKGEDGPDSDIDIAIEDDKIKETKVMAIKELGTLEDQIGRKITIHLFNRKNIDINLFNSIANGIILSGFLEVGK